MKYLWDVPGRAILGDLPLVGGLSRSITTSNIQSKLYVFVRADIIRPAEALAAEANLKAIPNPEENQALISKLIKQRRKEAHITI